MKYNKHINIFYLFILILFSWSCGDSMWKGQGKLIKVDTYNLPVQHQVKKIFNLSNGIYCSNNFDGARMNGVALTNDTLITVMITPENTPVNPSPWYCFKIWADQKQTISINLTYLENIKHRYHPKLSSDGQNWHLLDSVNLTFGEVERRKNSRKLANNIFMKLSIGPDTLWVSAQELISSKQVNTWMNELAANQFISMETIGKSQEGRPLNMLKIGSSNDSKMIMVLSRQHPPEVSGYLAMQSFVETICSSSENATNFRNEYNTYVVPMVNPDGVYNGHWRHNSGGIDLNRDWEEFNQPETSAVKRFMQNKVDSSGGKFYFGVDFHSTWEDIYYVLDSKLEGNMPGLVSKMIDSMSQELPELQPNIQPRPNDEKISSLSYFFFEFGAESLVFEIGDETSRDLVRKKGKISAMKLMELMLNNTPSQ